ncbi:hypothetical protein [Spirosoma fluviale]|uniref:Uncharacterized protein n=1 Tax=Spirosoma fluviale TaxID=1597977 RepID=A0A286GB97_9BACT|nr:hypothetical protein [Spirosoma fluviale]SOD92780.1 hypothetical protein SAMN06269250_4156 [Spirosoma fluviale]
MFSFSSFNRSFRVLLFTIASLYSSLFALAQTNLKYRLLTGYLLNSDAPVTKGKPTLFVFEQDDTFKQVFQQAATAPKRKADAPNFEREMAIGIALPPTKTPPKLSISRVFVQDSTLTVRYIRMVDTTVTKSPLQSAAQPMLLLSIPKQTVLRTRLVENGKVVQTVKKRETN